ncbi:MAG TPA: alpha/beta fold hydrolase, partial [Ramlibacter sp.]
LVCLQAEGDRAPWFCVHPVSGQVLCYRSLARQLGGGRPVHALQAADDDGSAPSVEALAERYVQAMREVQPQGPYHLGGWSLGGIIAYEMARRLAAAGEEVATLTLIDSYTPQALAALEEAQRICHPAWREDPDALLLWSFGQELGLTEAQLAQWIPAAEGAALATRLDALRDAAVRAGALDDDISADRWQRLFDRHRRLTQAMRRYDPAPQDLPRVAWFRAEASAAMVDEAAPGDWRALVGSGLQRLELRGDHHSVLREPQVGALASGLRAFLDAAGD